LTTEADALSLALYRALLDAGFAHWDRNGLPLLVVLAGSYSTKAQWFEAGLLAGQRVPLFLVGEGVNFRKRHVETIGRLGGWAVSLMPGDLTAQIARRGIVPSAWDKEASAAALIALNAKQGAVGSAGDVPA